MTVQEYYLRGYRLNERYENAFRGEIISLAFTVLMSKKIYNFSRTFH